MGGDRRSLFSLLLALCTAGAPASAATPETRTEAPNHYRATLRVPPTLEPLLQYVVPGRDAFPEEKDAEELAGRLGELGRRLRQEPGRAADAVDLLLAPDFRGGDLAPADVPVASGPRLEIVRSAPRGARESGAATSRAAFRVQMAALLAPFRTIEVAEFLITAIEPKPDGAPGARTVVRYDIVGEGQKPGRAQVCGRWRMDWGRGGDGAWRVVEWTGLDQVRSGAAGPVFTEVTAGALGGSEAFRRQLVPALDGWLNVLDASFMRESMGHHGVSAGDADGDGLDDLYVAQPAALPNRLFRNRGDGTFEDVTERAGLAVLDETAQSLFADVDNDGDQDLALVTPGGLLLFANDGGGRFARVPDAFRLKGALQGSPMAMAMADYDRDGFLDLYLCTYSYFIGAGEDKAGTPAPYHDARNGPPNVLFRNDGHGRFLDVTEDAGLREGNDRYSFAAAWADYDEDGWPDLLVANDFGRKNLYHNEGLKDGKVTFRDVSAQAGVEDHGAGMSATWLDYDNDGRLDIYTGNMWSAAGQRVTAQAAFMPDAPPEVRALYRRHARGNSLLRNRGDGTFEDVTLAARAEMGRWAWSSDALDFDNDGWEDLYVVNGMFTRDGAEQDLDGYFWRQVVARSPLTRVTGTPYDDAWRAINRLLARGSQANHQRNVFLRNDGHGGFDDVSGSVGLDLDQDGRSFAVLDYDGDGDEDLAVMAPRSSPQLRLFRNDFAETGGHLALRLQGTKGSRDAVGARVTVATDLFRRTRLVQAGSGFLSQRSKELLFGLGGSRRVSEVQVRWPSGLTQSFSNLEIGGRYRIEEGGQPRRDEARGAVAAVPPAAPPPPPSSPPASSWLYDPFPAPDLSVVDLAGQTRTLSALRGRPAVVLFWAASVPASRAAVQGLSEAQPALEGAGVQLLAVALDPAGDAPKVRALAQGMRGLPVALGSADLGVTGTLLNRYLFAGKEDLRLPTAFLLNAEGEIVKAYRAPITAGEILADVPRIAATPAERLARAAPFPGTLHGKAGRRNDLQFGMELVEQGLEAAALPAFERAARGDPSAFTLYSLGSLYMKSGQPEKARASFERALKVDPGFSEASNGLGALVAQGGNLPAAIGLFRSALDATPDYPDALNNLGYALLQSGREQEAYDLYQKALALQPGFPEAFNNLGIFHARQGDMKRAESYFRQALGKRPGYGEAGNNLALVLMAGDEATAAVDVLQKLLEANPAFEMTYVTLAKIYLATDRRREALQVLERLLQRNPEHPLARQVLKEARQP
jgi:Tfp pilus assembly protein PilF/peroxiredoxin